MRIWGHHKLEEGYKFYYRGWLYLGQRNKIVNLDFLLFNKDFSIGVTRGERDIKFHLAIPFIFSAWLHFEGFLPFVMKEKEISISTHNWALWWSFWNETNGWSSATPKWRHGAFHLDDFLFGRGVYSEEDVKDWREILVPMPEKSYKGKAKQYTATWTYPRWWTVRIPRVEIDMEEGIPFEGKGENSWDCGPDAINGITCQAKSIGEAVGKLVGDVLHDRVRYGGWGDWSWAKPIENNIPISEPSVPQQCTLEKVA